MKKSYLLTGIIGLTSLAILGACSSGDNGEAQNDGDVVTITFFDKNAASKTFDDRIAKEIEERTGVRIELENPTGDAGTKLSLMLSSRNYPDIVMMDRGSEIEKQYINSGAFIPLDELIEEFAPNVTEMYGDTINMIRQDDGQLYYLSNWYGPSDQPVNTWNMRYDYMVEAVGKERADSDEPFTQEEIIEVMKTFQENHSEVNGRSTYGLTIDETGRGLEGMFGLKAYYENNGNLEHVVKDPNYLSLMGFLNELHREGILDKEWITNNESLRNQKLSTGNIMGTVRGYWDLQSVNDANRAAGNDDAVFVSYKVVGDGINPSETTYSGRSSLGWDSIGITDNAKNPEAAIKLIDFLASREGQNLLLWGVEGEDYTVDENGDFIPNEEVLSEFVSDRTSAIDTTGIAKWTWFINNQGPTEGTPMRITDFIDQQTFESQMAYQNMTDSYWDTAEFDGLQPEPATPAGLKAQQITQIWNQAIPAMINANSENALEDAYNKMLSDMETAGLEEVEQAINQNYQERLESWK